MSSQNASLHKKIKFGLFARMLLALIFLIVSAIAILSVSLLKNAANQFDDFRLTNAQSLAYTLAEGSLDALITEDYELLERFVSSALPAHHGAYASLIRPDGKILTSTNLNLIAEQTNPITIAGNQTHRIHTYLERAVIEVIYKAKIGNKHLANAHIAYYIDKGNFSYLGQAKNIIFALILLLAVISLGTYIIVSRIKTPVLNLIDTVVNISNDKPIHISPKIYKRSDEVGSLARVFEDVFSRLSSANKKVRDSKDNLEIRVAERTQPLADKNNELDQAKESLLRSNELLEDKVKDRTLELKNINDELVQTRDAALDASNIKSEFLSTISHELRTPLHAISGYESLLKMTKLDEKQTEYCKKISQGSQNLLEIITDILDFSAFESGEIKIESKTFSLVDTITDICDMYKQTAIQKGLKVSCHIAEDIPSTIYTDPKRLRQTIVNLVSNAIKFTDNGSIEIKATLSSETENKKISAPYLKISVSDTGIGIKESEYQRIFTSFYQVDGSITRSYGGTGLGLAMSEKVMSLMGGDISISSKLGEGSTFTLSLPLVTEERDAINIDSRSSNENIPPSIYETVQTEHPLNKKIIIVEDSEINAELLTLLLDDIGYSADIAENGQIFLDMMNQNSYDLVLMDCQMPVLDGYDATKQYRESESDDIHIPIVAVTANAMDGDEEKCLACGMDDYISKPVNPALLKKKITKWLKSQSIVIPS